MKKKRLIAVLLAALMLLSLAACSSAPAAQAASETKSAETQQAAPVQAAAQSQQTAPAQAEAASEEPPATEPSAIDAQLVLIHSQIESLLQKESVLPWYYTVTDLDHDGSLEFIAASQHPADRSTNLKIWEVNADGTALTECKLEKEEEESFPDIMTDCADTFYDAETGTWSYLFYDNIVLSDTEVYTVKTSAGLKDGVISYEAYAVQHTVLENGRRDVSYTDNNGAAISQELYNAAGANAFADAERSSTNFDWFTEDTAVNRLRLADSFAVFMGTREPTETFPVPKPAAMQEADATPAPTATPAPEKKNEEPLYLVITKNPTNENRKAGDKAPFVACANAFDSLSWTFISPNGGEYTPANFAKNFPKATVTGQYSTTISVENVSEDMNGWGVYCTFYYKGQTGRTSAAYLYVKQKDVTPPSPAPDPTKETGTLYGTVIDYAFDTVTINVEGVDYFTVPFSICTITGNLDIGVPASVYYSGRYARGVNVVSCTITGREPAPQPEYGSMCGVAYHDTASTVYIVLTNGQGYHVDGYRVNILGGSEIEGASCIAYYTDAPTEQSIYQIDIYGYDVEPQPEPAPAPAYEPVYGVINGTAFQSITDGNKAELYLDNGDMVIVDNYSHGNYICTINGTLGAAGGGNPCRVFYVDYPSAANIYEVQISAAEDAG